MPPAVHLLRIIKYIYTSALPANVYHVYDSALSTYFNHAYISALSPNY